MVTARYQTSLLSGPNPKVFLKKQGQAQNTKKPATMESNLQEPRTAKRDPRLQESGPLKGFQFDGFTWPLEPKTAFYDWLYVGFLKHYRDWATKLYAYSGFTDIEFNPHRSINCQARSCAFFLSLMKMNLLDEPTRSPQDFLSTLSRFNYRPQLRTERDNQDPLF